MDIGRKLINAIYRSGFNMPINQPKKPRGKDNYVGVEIEFFAPIESEPLWKRFSEAKLGKYLHLKDDGSIDVPAKYQESDDYEELPCTKCSHRCGMSKVTCCYCGGLLTQPKARKKIQVHESHELAILVKQSEMEDVVKRVCKILQDSEAKVNASCGLHVHLDMRNREPSKAYANLVLTQPLLFRLVTKGRKRSGYCDEVSQGTSFESMTHGDRYRTINASAYEKFKTIEVRMHHGTIDGEKIVNWICLLLETIEADPLDRIVRTIKDVNRLKVSPKVLQYVSKEARKRA
jgi:putative amidoligase enzyme